MNLAWKLNPLLAHLLQKKTLYLFDELMPILLGWGVDVVVIIAIFVGPLDSSLLFLIPLGSLIYIPTMFVPMLVGSQCASLTSRLNSNQSYEQLSLTDVSNKTILWSCIVSTLYRARLLLIIVIGLSPITFMMASIASGILRIGFDPAVTNSSGNTYYSNDDMALEMTFAVEASVMMLELAAGVAGVIILTCTAGGIVGLRLKDRLITLRNINVIAFIVSIFVGVAIFPKGTLRTLGQSNDLSMLFFVFLLALVPYILTFGLIKSANRLAR